MENDIREARDPRFIIWAGNLHMKNAKEIKNKRAAPEIKVAVSTNKSDLLSRF